MFAVSQFTTNPCSAEEDLARYAEAGVEAMELCEAKFPDSEKQRRELVARLKDTPIKVTSVQATVHSMYPDRMAGSPESPEKRLEAFKRSVGFWSEVLEEDNLPFVLISGVVPEQNFREGWRAGRAWIKKAAAFAETCGARIAFEPLAPSMMYFDTFVYGLDQGVRMMEAAESNAAGLVIDAMHVWEEYELERRLTELAPRVWVVHACDLPADGPRGLDDRLLPGEGVIPLRDKIFGPLRSGGYKGPFTIEVLSDQSLEGSLWAMDPDQLLAKAKKAAAPFG